MNTKYFKTYVTQSLYDTVHLLAGIKQQSVTEWVNDAIDVAARQQYEQHRTQMYDQHAKMLKALEMVTSTMETPYQEAPKDDAKV